MRARAATKVLAAAAALAAAGCGSTPPPVPLHDFDRPTDMTFVCMGTFDENLQQPDGGTSTVSVVSGRPMTFCHPNSKYDPPPDTVNHNRTFAFVTSSGSGQLNVIDADNSKLVDLDPAVQAYNEVPLGIFPEQIAASDDGCRVVAPNRGSCNLSFVNPAALLAPVLGQPCPGGGGSNCRAQPIQTISPVAVRPDGTRVKLNLAPQEVQFLPQDISHLDGANNLCSLGGGAAPTAAPYPWSPAAAMSVQGWEALVTFPSCDLIALVDLPTGEIRDSVKVVRGADGRSIALEPQGQNPSCAVADCGLPVPAATPDSGATPADGGAAPDDAGVASDDGSAASDGGADDASASDASATDGGAPLPPATPSVVPFLGPGPIAVAPGGQRAYVGLANPPYGDLGDQPLIVAVDITTDGKLAAPSAGAGILLHEGARGVTRVRLSVNPYLVRQGVTMGEFVAPTKGNYLYAVARDGSLRVVQVPDLTTTTGMLVETECETNAASTAAQAASPCLPVGTTPRRQFALGPGIRLPTAPVDVTVADIRLGPTPTTDTPAQMCVDINHPDPNNMDPKLRGGPIIDCSGGSLETTVSGTYAWVLSANGAVYLINIDPVKRVFQAIPDADGFTLTYVQEDPPPVNALRDRNVQTFSRALDFSSGPPRVDVVITPPTSGPRIETIWTRGTLNNAVASTSAYVQTNVSFPDRRAVTPQTWNVTWEGNIVGPRATASIIPVGDGFQSTLQDPGADFCSAGALKGDIVTILGCVADADCGFGKVCLHGTNGALGAAGLPINGLCVDPKDTARKASPNGCAGMLDTVRRYEVIKATRDTFTLQPRRDELVRANNHPCTVTPTGTGGAADGGAADGGAGGATGTGGADGGIVPSDCADNSLDPAAKNFECITETDDQGVAQNRCLQRCTKEDSTEECRAGRVCVKYPNLGLFCADGARVNHDCVDQYMPYQVGVGRGFVLAGSQLGVPATGTTGADGTCQRDPAVNNQVVTRIPIDTCSGNLPGPGNCAAKCVPNLDNNFDSRCNPDSTTTCPANTDPNAIAAGLLNILQTAPQPDNAGAGSVCSFIGGPNDTDSTVQTNSMGMPAANPLTHQHMLVRNTQMAFVMTNLEQGPPGTLAIQFDVHGGFGPQAVVNFATVDISLPSRILVGPLDSNPGTADQQKAQADNSFERPYVFVVDRRRAGTSQSGGPTRGQILRINPLTTIPGINGLEPAFDDHSRSNNLFPIE